MQLDPVNNEDHTQHVMQWACPRRGPAHQQRAMEARLLRMRSPRLEFATLVGIVGERLYPYQSTTKRTRGPLKRSQEGEDHDMEQARDPRRPDYVHACQHNNSHGAHHDYND